MSFVVSDLKQLHAFVEGQSKILSVEALSKLLEGQAQQLSLIWGRDGSQINMTTLGELSSLIAAGPWNNSQKEKLGNVLGNVAARLTKSENPTGSAFRGRRPSQHLKAFSGFLTPSDLASLRSDAHNNIKIGTLVKRCYSVGLHLPSEPTMQHIISTGLSLGMTGASGEQKHLLLKEFKAQLRNMVKHRSAPPVFLVEFPKDPKELPEDLFKMAYDEEKPVAPDEQHVMVCSGLGALDVPCRRSNKLVRKSSGLDIGGSQEGNNAMNMLGAMMVNFFQQQAGSSGSDPFANLQVFQNKRRQKQLEYPSTNEEKKVDTVPVAPSVALALEDARRPDSNDEGGSDAKGTGKSEVETAQSTATASVKKNKVDEVKDDKDIFDLGHDHQSLATSSKPEDAYRTLMSAHEKREEKKKLDPKKRPAASKAKAKVKKNAPLCKTPSKSKPLAADNPKSSEKLPPPPKSGEGTFHWKGGKIHRSDRGLCWRVFLKSSDRNDRKVLWHGDEKASFKRALAMIEQGK